MEKKYYVYILCDPRHSGEDWNHIFKPFYVGKGCGNRAQTHLLETEENTENIRKFLKIQKIRKVELEPIINLYATELLEENAYVLEAELIKEYGRAKIDEDGILTNICIDNRPPNLKGRTAKSPDIETRLKISESLKNKPQNEKNEIIQKIKETIANKTQEERDEINRKISDTLTNKSQEEKDEIKKKSKETIANKTQEERDEINRKISDTLTGRVNGPPSEETKQKIGDAQRGELNHRYGKHWSEEEKQRRSEWAKTNNIKPPIRTGKMSQEQKDAIGAGNRGKKRTPEQSAYLSSIRKGKLKGPTSEETKQKIRLGNNPNAITPEIGMQFGLWTVLKKSNKINPNVRGSQGIYWTCQCSCDKKTIKDANQRNLVDGTSTSCGCRKIKRKL